MGTTADKKVIGTTESTLSKTADQQEEEYDIDSQTTAAARIPT